MLDDQNLEAINQYRQIKGRNRTVGLVHKQMTEITHNQDQSWLLWRAKLKN